MKVPYNQYKAARDIFVFYFYIMKKGGRGADTYIIYIFILYPELKLSKRAWRITLQL